MDAEERERRMFAKLRAEDEHHARLTTRGLDSFTIADQLIHLMLEALEEGFRSRFPGEDDDLIKERMRHRVLSMNERKRRKK